MEKVFIYWGVIYGVMAACVYLVKCFDTGTWSLMGDEGRPWFWFTGSNGVIILWLSRNMGTGNAICLSVLAGCLLFACMTDCKTNEVFQFTWWIAGIPGVVLLCKQCAVDFQAERIVGFGVEQRFVPLLFYILLQEFFFCRFYGRADCHAFVICAVVGCGLYIELIDYLLHMALAFGGLFFVQAFRGNIGKTGNLKHPVPFLPYITVSFWVLLFLEKSVILNRISEKIF